VSGLLVVMNTYLYSFPLSLSLSPHYLEVAMKLYQFVELRIGVTSLLRFCTYRSSHKREKQCFAEILFAMLSLRKVRY